MSKLIHMLGNPLPDWFMNGMSIGRIILNANYDEGRPFEHGRDLTAYCWNGDEIQVAYRGQYIVDNGDNTYTVLGGN